MINSTRRDILATGVAATAMAAAPKVLAQAPGGTTMGSYKKGAVSIHFEEGGSGFPLLVIPGGGLNSTIASLSTTHRRSTRWRNSRASTAASPPTCAMPPADSPQARSRSTGRGMPLPTTTSA